MNTIAILVYFLIIIVALISGFILAIIKIRQLEGIISTMSIDVDRLKKVSVGNYVDIVKIKRRLGIDDTDTKNTENEES